MKMKNLVADEPVCNPVSPCKSFGCSSRYFIGNEAKAITPFCQPKVSYCLFCQPDIFMVFLAIIVIIIGQTIS